MSDMASSSSSYNQEVKYDVFLSFRGADTRINFTSHLHSALIEKGIVTFTDNRLKRGEEIEAAILKAIEESDVSIVVISKNFATSAWCLDELLKIFECKDTQAHKVIPVFYHVNPDNVTGNLGEAMARLRHDNMEKVGKWREVLERTAKLSGVVIDKSRSESEFIEDIVNEISKILSHPNHYFDGFKKLVGVEPRVSKVELSLSMGSNDVRLIGIWGMGGIGKTTIAKIVCQKYAYEFDRTCCLENVRDHNLDQLQAQLLVQLLSEGNIHSRLNFDMRLLRHKKVLIVLDNVDKYEQIERLAGAKNWFGKGSRIIITSRDKSVFQSIVDGMYEVEVLTDGEALYLFHSYAFKEDHSKRNHTEISLKVVSYAGGNPLALKVLGLFFYNKCEEEQTSALKKLEKFPDKGILNVLKISYDGLDSHDQQIFLDIACFFKGASISKVVDILDACGSFTLIGLRALADKSLIIMSNGIVDMHDLLQELGRHIVCQESTEPGKRSRLWDHEDIYHVFKKNTGTDAVESICLDQSKIKMLSLHPQVFDTMNGIKLFRFYNSNINEHYLPWHNTKEIVSNNVVLPADIEYLPDELRFFQWHFYPGISLPSNFLPSKLVEIDLSGSSIKTLWTGVQDLPNLKVIKLINCKQLSNLPHLSRAPNVCVIDCTNCISLVEVCPSINSLNKLKELYLNRCKKVTSVPEAKCLRSLCLVGSGIKKFPQVPTTIEYLDLADTDIEEIPSSIRLLSQLKCLTLHQCGRIKNIPDFVLQYLKHLKLLAWGQFQFEKNISFLSSLKSLYLIENELESIPSCIRQMSCLKELNLFFCKRLRSLPKLPPSLQRLTTSHCTSLNLASSSLLGLEEHWGIFFFGNCTNLNEKELRSILIYARRRILSLAKNIEEFDGRLYCLNKNCKDCDGQFVAAIPGNIIPNWLPHQSIGYSITIPLPENWFHNCLGFVLAIVFDFGTSIKNRPKNMYMERWMMLEGRFKSNCDENSYCISAAFHYDDWSIGSVHDRANSPAEQLLLWYNKNFSFTHKDLNDSNMCQYKEVTFKIVIKDEQQAGRPLPSSVIKKCGVGLLYNGKQAEAEPMATRRSKGMLNMRSSTLPSSSNKRCRRKDSP